MANSLSWLNLLKVLPLVILFGIYGTFLFLMRMVLVGPKAFFHYKKRNTRPSILEGNTYGEHVFVRLKKSRVKIHCVVGGPKDAPLMVFLHGFPEFWYSWRHQIKEFNKKYRTVAIDMRGYGESDKPQGVYNYEIGVLVDDVNDLITHFGYSSCILVSHDWGGVVAWKFASDYPEKVDRMIVANIPHPLAFEEHIHSSLSQVLKSWYVFFFQLPMLPIYFLLLNDLDFLESCFTTKGIGAKQGTFTEEDIECFKYNFAEYGDICGPVNFYRAALRYKPDSISLAKKISKPTLLIWGTADGALDTKMAEISKKYVENLKVEYIEGASHWVQQECPAEFNAHMKAFLSQ